eukprot:c19994_g3_i1 orf=304-762(-)
MAADLARGSVSSIIERDSKKRPGSGELEAAVYEQLVERVRVLEESLMKMAREDTGKSHDCGVGMGKGASARCRKPMYSTAEKVAGKDKSTCYTFQMPTHYPRYRKADYEVMPESLLDRLLEEYGLPVNVASTLAEKREYAMGVFLWNNEQDN